MNQKLRKGLLFSAAMAYAGFSCLTVQAQTMEKGSNPPDGLLTRAMSVSEGIVSPISRVRPSDEGLVMSRQHRPKQTLPRHASAGKLPAIYGSIVNAETWSNTSKVGVYQLPTTASDGFVLQKLGPNAEYGGTLIDNTYYAAYIKSSFIEMPTIASYDITSWEQLSTGGTESYCMATDVAYDATTGKTFGCFMNASGSGMQLGSINYRTQMVEKIASATDNWCAFAVDTDGTLYGIAKEITGSAYNPTTVSSSLYRINKTTGAKSLVGETGCLPHYQTSACIDTKTGRMFWTVAAADGTAGLYEVNKQTGAASLITQFADGEQVCGLYIIPAEADDKAPAKCSDVAASFPQGNLSGSITFKAPSTLFDGTTASGSLSYKITHGQNIEASGNTTYGATVTVPITVQSAGKYEFGVTAYNATGDGPTEKIEVFIGKGTPSQPSVTASYANGSFHVEWTPVTESTDGGYINPADVRYKVVRYPSQVVVEQATSATSVENAMDEPTGLTQFWYGVQASYGGKNSPEALSNKVTLGSIVPPYQHSFATEAGAENHTVIDANNDGKTWGYYSNSMSISYNNNVAMDDWLITPPVRLEKGKSYSFTVKGQIQSTTYPERIEVKFGSAPTAEAMTGTVIEPVVLTNKDSYNDFTGTIIPQETGLHYIGIHGISDKGMYRLYIGGYEIGAPTSAAGPNAPTNLKLVPDANGAYRVTVTVTAPTTDFANEPITELDRLEIWRGETLVKSFSPISTGETKTFTDEMGQGGITEYTAVAYNRYGKGKETKATVFVGINQPAAPSYADIAETSNYGEVKVSWPQVETDLNGNPLNPSLVTYTLYQLQAETHVVIADNIEGTEYTFRAVADGEQSFVHYFVSAQTEGGISPLTETPLIPAGTPFALPYDETFANGDTDHLMAFTDEGTAMWSLLQDNNNLGIRSHSGDNGLLMSRGKTEGDFSLIHTMKIHVDNIVQPGVMFYTYNYTGDGPDNNIVEIHVYSDGEWTTLKSSAISSLGDDSGWLLMSAPLDAYIGKDILVGIKTIVKTYSETFIDDIHVGTLVGHDLSVKDVQAPQSAGFNTPFGITATIENKGILAAENFSVVLLRDGNEADRKSDLSLAAGATAIYGFECEYNALTDKGSVFKIKVEDAAEETPEDNESAEFTVALSTPTLPHVSDLKGYRSENGIELRWSEPSTDDYKAVPVTDDFESYDSFITSGIGEWTTVDNDEALIGTITDITIPNIPYQSKQSWWVMDSEYESLNLSFFANSGSKYLAQMYVTDPQTGVASQCDDWLISPELTGEAQTLSFYARSYAAKYAEDFEVMVSYNTDALTDFRSIGSKTGIPATWTLYSYGLPEGAKYFAIRCVSRNKFMMFIDDITYTPESAAHLNVIGYNVWKDGELISTEPINATNYLDNSVTEQDPAYRVTVVYDKGESVPSDIAEITIASITDAYNDADIKVSASAGTIRISGAEGMDINIAAADGRVIYTDMASSPNVSVNVVPGIYIVCTGTTSHKVVVD